MLVYSFSLQSISTLHLDSFSLTIHSSLGAAGNVQGIASLGLLSLPDASRDHLAPAVHLGVASLEFPVPSSLLRHLGVGTFAD
jgi:hypothetical protein